MRKSLFFLLIYKLLLAVNCYSSLNSNIIPEQNNLSAPKKEHNEPSNTLSIYIDNFLNVIEEEKSSTPPFFLSAQRKNDLKIGRGEVSPSIFQKMVTTEKQQRKLFENIKLVINSLENFFRTLAPHHEYQNILLPLIKEFQNSIFQKLFPPITEKEISKVCSFYSKVKGRMKNFHLSNAQLFFNNKNFENIFIHLMDYYVMISHMYSQATTTIQESLLSLSPRDLLTITNLSTENDITSTVHATVMKEIISKIIFEEYTILTTVLTPQIQKFLANSLREIQKIPDLTETWQGEIQTGKSTLHKITQKKENDEKNKTSISLNQAITTLRSYAQSTHFAWVCRSLLKNNSLRLETLTILFRFTAKEAQKKILKLACGS